MNEQATTIGAAEHDENSIPPLTTSSSPPVAAAPAHVLPTDPVATPPGRRKSTARAAAASPAPDKANEGRAAVAKPRASAAPAKASPTAGVSSKKAAATKRQGPPQPVVKSDARKAVASHRALAKPLQPAKPAAAPWPVKKAAAGSIPNAPGERVGAPVTKAPVKPKAKLVRDSFTMPQRDFSLIALLKDRALDFKRPTKKSELLRAGLHALSTMKLNELKGALEQLTPIKSGRRKNPT